MDTISEKRIDFPLGLSRIFIGLYVARSGEQGHIITSWMEGWYTNPWRALARCFTPGDRLVCVVCSAQDSPFSAGRIAVTAQEGPVLLQALCDLYSSFPTQDDALQAYAAIRDETTTRPGGVLVRDLYKTDRCTVAALRDSEHYSRMYDLARQVVFHATGTWPT